MNKIITVFSLLIVCYMVQAQEINVKHTTLKLQLDWQKKQAIGIAEITFSVLMQTNTIVLDAGYLSIKEITLDSKPLSFIYDGGDNKNNLLITLDTFYSANKTLTIQIAYHTNYENKADPNAISGSFGKGLRFFQPTTTTPNKRKQIWSCGESETNKYWFPCHEDISDIQSVEVMATVEKPLMVVSNGNLVETIDHQNGTQTFHYKSETEFSTYLTFIVVGEFSDIRQKCKQIVIHNFGYPDEKKAVKATTVNLPDMMHFLESKTGYPYPFKTYSQVVVQDYPFPGLVGQHAASILSDNYVDDDGVHKDFKYLWDGVAVQALANQWFGNLLMPESWQDIWLNNAFAQYFAGKYTEKDNAKAEYLLWYYPFEKGAVLNDWQSNNKHAIVPDKIEQLELFTTDNYSKYKGALVLHMLQHEMGNTAWWKTIQYFVNQFANKQVNTKNFQEAVEKISGTSYQWFFDQWVYKTGFPKFTVKKSYDEESKKLALTVIQTQDIDSTIRSAQVDFFQGKIEIEVDSKIYTVLLKPQKENTFEFSCKKEPAFVNFNVENKFLCEVEYKQTKDEYLSLLKRSNDILAKQDALNKLVAIANDSLTTNQTKGTIKAVFIAEIESDKYWRWRMIVLGALSKISTLPYDLTFTQLLQDLIINEESWLKSTAIGVLGKTYNEEYLSLYVKALQDKSDRVVNAAAVAIGKTKSSKAFDILMDLEQQKSWKNQNRISALNGLEQLGDVRAAGYALTCLEDNRSPRWYLATPVWDYPFAAINLLTSLGKAQSAYPILYERFKKSLNEDDLNDVFQNLQLIDLLNDKRAVEVYVLLKEKFKDDKKILEIIYTYEKNYLQNMNQ